MVSSRIESLLRLQTDALAELLYAIDECNDNVHTAIITRSIERVNEIVYSTVQTIVGRNVKDVICIN